MATNIDEWVDDPVSESDWVDDATTQPQQQEYSQGLLKTYEGQPQGILQNADVMAGKVANLGMEAIQAPFEMAGEAMRGAGDYLMGQKTDFNAPKLFGGQGAQDPFGYANKVARTAVAGLSAPLRGQSMSQQARAEYNRPQSNIDTMADVTTGLASTFLAPKISNAPMEAVAEGLGKAKSLFSSKPGVPSMFRKASAKALSLLGPEEDALLKRMENPEAIKQAGTVADVSNSLPGVANKFNTVIGHLSDKADDVISTSKYLEEGAFSKDEVMGSVEKARRNLGGIYTDESRSAEKVIKRIQEKFKRVRNTVSQNQVKTIIKDLDSEIPWTKVWKSPETLTATDRAMIDMRTNLDSALKAKNTPYAELMKPVSDAIQARGEFIKKFNLEKVRGGGYQLGDNTVNRMANTMNDNKVASQRVLGQVKETTGEDVLSRLENAKAKEQFQAPTSNTLDDILRFKPSTIISLIQDKMGRSVAGKVADIINKAGKAPNVFGGAEKLARPVTPVSGYSAPVSKMVLDKETARMFYEQAGGDKEEARRLAAEAGY